MVIVRNDKGAFEPRDVKLGTEQGDTLEVVEGLNEGDPVVVSGQFLIDSEARLRSVLGTLSAASPSASAASATAAGADRYAAEGKVESVDADSITISHGAIAELKWPAMTMGFGKADPKAFADVKPGDRLHFEFRKGGPMGYELVSVHRLGGAK